MTAIRQVLSAAPRGLLVKAAEGLGTGDRDLIPALASALTDETLIEGVISRLGRGFRDLLRAVTFSGGVVNEEMYGAAARDEAADTAGEEAFESLLLFRGRGHMGEKVVFMAEEIVPAAERAFAALDSRLTIETDGEVIERGDSFIRDTMTIAETVLAGGIGLTREGRIRRRAAALIEPLLEIDDGIDEAAAFLRFIEAIESGDGSLLPGRNMDAYLSAGLEMKARLLLSWIRSSKDLPGESGEVLETLRAVREGGYLDWDAFRGVRSIPWDAERDGRLEAGAELLIKTGLAAALLRMAGPGVRGGISALAISPLGEAALGRRSMEESDERVLVGPDFSVMASRRLSFAVRSRLSRFARLVRSDNMDVRMIERRSVERAMDMGMRVDDMLDLLEEASDGRVPENLVETMRDWEREYERFRLVGSPVLLVRNKEDLAWTREVLSKEKLLLAEPMEGVMVIGRTSEAALRSALAGTLKVERTGMPGGDTGDLGRFLDRGDSSRRAGGFFRPIFGDSPKISRGEGRQG